MTATRQLSKFQRYELYKSRELQKHEYIMCPWFLYNYKVLELCSYSKKKNHSKKISNAWIMLDTETSKKANKKDNHICAWTISIRFYERNVVTLYGQKPSEIPMCINRIAKHLSGDKIVIYVHNFAYDYVFCRKFFFKAWGYPTDQMNLKSHYPLFCEFDNRIIFKDSLILLQRKLETAAIDFDVEHKKAIGSWDYDLLRNQDHILTPEELHYIENDTLAGVEILNTLANQLGKRVCNMPFTATGIPREESRKRGKKYYAHELFAKIAPSFEIYQILVECYHGGFTHANRHYINMMINDVTAFDFSSSYPYCMCAFKYPMGAWTSINGKMSLEEIIQLNSKYGFIFKLTMFKPRLKSDDIVMPALQFSKCFHKSGEFVDNGRIIYADFVELYINSIDLDVIYNQYDYEFAYCSEIYYSTLNYLPRWFTDYVYELFKDKTQLKGVKGQELNYMLQKAKLNSLYGMCVMRQDKLDIEEDYMLGEYHFNEDSTPEDQYDKFIKKRSSIFPYCWGVWVTSYAMRNLHELGSCVADDGIWLYSDTDSCYATKWNMDKLNAYNDKCKQLLTERGYGAVIKDGKEYWLGVAEFDGHYKSFKCQGAKRYAVEKEDGSIKITVAGVPKKMGSKYLQDMGGLDYFEPGLIFPGKKTGKLQHEYIIVDDIYIDENGNETGDSINLEPCDYLLDCIDRVTLDDILNIESEVNVYDE